MSNEETTPESTPEQPAVVAPMPDGMTVKSRHTGTVTSVAVLPSIRITVSCIASVHVVSNIGLRARIIRSVHRIFVVWVEVRATAPSHRRCHQKTCKNRSAQ